MKQPTASAPGKIILSGEYAVVFGKRGIAIPSKESVTVTWTEDASLPGPVIDWDGGVDARWITYVERIFGYLEPLTGKLKGKLLVQCELPLGKGMGSSTSLVIAVCRCFLGPDCREAALSIEDQINPGHSGIDFAVIFENIPILYARGKEREIPKLPNDILKGARLIDSGRPNETTKELVAWMKSRYPTTEPTQSPLPATEQAHSPLPATELAHSPLPATEPAHSPLPAAGTSRPKAEGMNVYEAINSIGDCTERLLKGESLHTVMRDHHHAQVALGIVPDSARTIIEHIESEGGSAKVIGAGGRAGGGGMVLVLP